MANVAVNIGTWRGAWAPDMNVGDWKSSPTHYFSLGMTLGDAYQTPPTDVQHLVVGGGGLWHPMIMKGCRQWIMAAQGARIAWGVGHNVHDKYAVHYEHGDMFDLFGTRDWGYEKTVADGVWVPCASCMDPAFDEIKPPVGDRVAVIIHKNRAFPTDLPVITNFESFENIIDLIANHDIILTNSYHGMYWSVLSGRRVIVVNPLSSRFIHSRFQVPLAPATNWQSHVNMTKEYPEALELCREANRGFYKSVRALLR